MRWSRAIAVAIPLAVAMGGCLNTGFVRHDMGTDLEAASSSSWPARRVIYQLDRRLLEDPPECVALTASAPAARDGGGRVLESALERHLAVKVRRVVFARKVRETARRMALDLDEPGDLHHLADAVTCEAILTWRVIDAGDIFLGVWSERHLHLEVILADAVDAAPLWRARHAGRRADGGLPLLPLTVPVIVADAARHHGDGDLNASLIDDVTRRLFSTLPSLR